MRRGQPMRSGNLARVTARVAVIALLASGAVATAGAPVGPHRGRGDSAASGAAAVASAVGQQLPAPPRPPTSRPTQHVVTTGSRVTNGAYGIGGVDGTLRAAGTTRSTGLALAATPLAATPLTATAGSGRSASSAATARTLVLYDTTGSYGWLGEAYATAHREPGQPLRRVDRTSGGHVHRRRAGRVLGSGLYRLHVRRAAAGRVPR